MSESDIDIDKLGTLKLEHFEHDSDIDVRIIYGSQNRSVMRHSTSSSPSPTPSCYYSEECDSPVSSPNEPFYSPIHSPLSSGSNSSSSSSGCLSSSSDDDLPTGDVVQLRKRRNGQEHYREPMISKRNERERKRVKLISEGFSMLRKRVLDGPANRKVPKLQILRQAIYYIKALQEMLEESDRQIELEKQGNSSECYTVQRAEIQDSLMRPQAMVKPEHTMYSQCYHHTDYHPPFEQQWYQYNGTSTTPRQKDPWFLHASYTQ